MRNPFIDQITYLGKTTGRKPKQTFGIYQSDRLYHQYIIGQTGTGKSTLLFNMIKQDIDAGRGFCLIDPHGDLAEAAALYIGENGIYWKPSDPKCNVGYNPLTYVAEQYRPLVASGIIETLKQQWSDAWGVRMEHILRFTLLALLSRPNSTLADIIHMATKKSFRTQVLKHVTDEEVLKFWKDEFPNMNYKNAFDGVAPIANKLGAFMSNPNVRKALCNPEQTLRFRKLMDDGTPLVVNLSKGQLGTDVSNVLGGLIVSMMGNAAYSRVNIQEQRRRPYYLYVDEFHSFTTDAFATALAEFRKYRLALIMVSQTTTQYSSKVLDSILGNVGTITCFRMGTKDAPIMTRQLGWIKGRPEILHLAYISDLPNWQFYIQMILTGVKEKVFLASTYRSI
jgi:type IV secretory pathway TraG/TraD family ATPase VirD4